LELAARAATRLTASWMFVVPLVAAGCVDLPAPGVCGNHVHEPELGEDCDDDSVSCTSNCRLTCQVQECPDGYQCGLDKICSLPSGRLAYPTSSVSFGPSFLAVVDYDSDSIGDVIGIGTGDIDVRFGSAAADLARSYSLRTPLQDANGARPAVTRTFDGTVAAVVPSAGGITVYYNAGTALLPLATPALGDTFDVRTAAVACGDTDCELVAVGNDAAGQPRLVIGNYVSDPAVPPCGVTDAEAARVTIARTRTDDVVVVARPDRVCAYSLAGSLLDSLPTTTATRWIAANLDADPCDELIVDQDTNAGEHVIINLGGPGCGTTTESAAISGTVLAAGDLDGDGATDLVLDTASGMTEARVADLNRDGYVDIVGRFPSGGVGVLQGSATGFSLRFPDFPAVVESLDVADLDGDTFPDVVMVEGGTNAGLLAVGFGSPQGPEPAIMFGFAQVTRPIVASARDLLGMLHSDVVITTTDGMVGSVVRYSIGLNRALAPISPVPGTGPPVGVLISTLLPTLPSDKPYPDIVALTASGTATGTESSLSSLWIPGGSVSPEGLPVTESPFFGTLATSYLAGYDAGPPDNIDDGIAPWFEPVALEGRAAIVVARRDHLGVPGAVPESGTADGLVLFPTRPPTGDLTLQVPSTIVHLVPAGTADVRRHIERVHAVEVDGDLASELAVITADTVCTGLDPVRVCFEESSAFLVDLALDGSTATTTATLTDRDRFVTAGLMTDADRLSCVDAVGMDLGPDVPDGPVGSGVRAGGAQAVVLACLIVPAARDANNVVIVDMNSGQVVFDDPVAAAFGFVMRDGELVGPFALLRPLPYVGDLAAGDVTGDGLDDLVIHGLGQLAVAVQCPHHDTTRCP